LPLQGKCGSLSLSLLKIVRNKEKTLTRAKPDILTPYRDDGIYQHKLHIFPLRAAPLE